MEDFSIYGAPSPEWLKLVASTPEVALPGPNPTLDSEVLKLQDLTNSNRETISAQAVKSLGLDAKVTWQDHAVPARDGTTIPLRIYRPRSPQTNHSTPLPVYIFYHGGGYLFGTLSTEDAACSKICAAVPCIVVNVNYRHTPQCPYPASHHDAWDAFEWVCAHAGDIGGDPEKLLVGGISAGGGLASSVVLRDLHLERSKGNKGRVTGQILCIPWLIYGDAYPAQLLEKREKSSYVQCAGAPVLPRERLEMFTRLLMLGGEDSRDPYLSVGNVEDEELKGMPKTALLIAGNDPLRDEGLTYAGKLGRKGVPTKIHVFPGLPHGFRRFNDLPASQRWDQLIVERIKWVLSGETQPGMGLFVE